MTLALNEVERKLRDAIIELLEPFRTAGEIVSAEDDITCSMILPVFGELKQNLKPNPNDLEVIKDMKKNRARNF